MQPILESLDAGRPVLIAGPTASGKSALALAVAETLGGQIINADALQVFADWRVLTARPTAADEARARHALYGHVPGNQAYSVGQWLRDVAPLLGGPRAIIVGGTGLYFAALTEGLADIPPTPQTIRAEADAILERSGPDALLAGIDPVTASRLDTRNPVRVQRAWEVQRSTGRGLAAWQDETGPPLLPLSATQPVVLHSDTGWLNERIARRFELMLKGGALDEARANLDGWRATLPSAKAIGAAELMAHLRGEITLQEARDRAVTLSRQYAKRQRSWFRSRMGAWRWYRCDIV
ncbi:MAG: tRNA (adenosine(37)-N6)-dimethylallyltransferase MiaA [Rhodobacteraceae bacterium]|nr:tRNA (adenosine(37)-N6)-dimethylallyltransferase MiaA [Paracoccaceae bacterium]